MEEPRADAKAVLTYSELQEQERKNILKALETSRWRISGPNGAAAKLGIKPSTLTSKIKVMGLSRAGN